jgi:hypothetical protein
MRQVEQQMIAAIRARKSGEYGGNTRVDCHGASVRVYLFGNLIAEFTPAATVRVTLAGWNTNTTRSRVNALLSEFLPGNARVFTSREQASFRQFEQTQEIGDSEWIEREAPQS